MRVSIVMGTYNSEPYLAEQLESLLGQDRSPDEIVVCDDDSSDGTWVMLKEYHHRFPHLMKIYRNRKNLGPAINFERAIGLCTGDFIAPCDQDDIWRRDKLDTLARRLEEDSGLGLVFSNAELVDHKGTELGTDLWTVVGFHSDMKAQVRRGEALQTFLRKPIASGCTIMFRATLKKTCLPIGEPLMHDHWISLVAAANSRVDFVDERLISYRQHATNKIGASRLSLRQRVQDSERLGISQCVQDVAGLRKLIERLGDADQNQISLIRQKIDFLEFRIWLWSGRASWLRRSISLVRKATRGQYGRWGNGPRTVVKDAAMLLGVKRMAV